MPKACRKYCGAIQLRYRRDTAAASDPAFGPAANISLLNAGTGVSGVAGRPYGCRADNIVCTSKYNASNKTGRCSESALDTSPSNTEAGGSGLKVGRTAAVRIAYAGKRILRDRSRRPALRHPYRDRQAAVWRRARQNRPPRNGTACCVDRRLPENAIKRT